MSMVAFRPPKVEMDSIDTQLVGFDGWSVPGRTVERPGSPRVPPAVAENEVGVQGHVPVFGGGATIEADRPLFEEVWLYADQGPIFNVD